MRRVLLALLVASACGRTAPAAPRQGSGTPQPRLSATIAMEGQAWAVAATANVVWVAEVGPGPDRASLVAIDPDTNEIIRRVRIHGPMEQLIASPTDLFGLEGGPDGVAIVRFDVGTGAEVGRHPEVTGPLFLADGGVWAGEASASGDDGFSLIKMDTTSLDVVSRVPVLERPWLVAPDGYYLWTVPSRNGADLTRLDLRTGAASRIELGATGTLYGPVVGRDSVWIPEVSADFRFRLIRMSRIDGTVADAAASPAGGGLIAEALGQVWTLHEAGSIRGFDIASMSVGPSAELNGPPLYGSLPSAAFDPYREAIWVCDYGTSVSRVDLRID